MLAPPVLFFFFNIEAIGSGNIDATWYLSQSSWFLSYIITSVSLYGFAIYLVGRRESGFLRSFVIGRADKLLFVSAQLISAITLSLIYVSFFFLTTSISFGINFLEEISNFIGPYLVVTLVFTSSSVLFLLIPLNFQNANSVVSILFMLMVMISLASLRVDNTILDVVNSFNPIHVGQLIISQELPLSSTLILFITLLLLINVAIASTLKTNPIWEGQ